METSVKPWNKPCRDYASKQGAKALSRNGLGKHTERESAGLLAAGQSARRDDLEITF